MSPTGLSSFPLACLIAAIWRTGVAVEFLDNTTQNCYRALIPREMNALYDRAHGHGIKARTVDRPDTLRWCLGNYTSSGPFDPQPPSRQCKQYTPEADGSNFCETCERGFDLLQWPEASDCSTSRVLYVHGGSWTSGSPWSYNYDVHTSKIASKTNSVVLSIDYPLVGAWAGLAGDAAEAQYGTYVGDAAALLKYALGAWAWLAGHGPNSTSCSGAAPAMFVAGDSSGGGSAAALLLELLERDKDKPSSGLPVPAGAFFESVWLNLASDTPTYYSNTFAAFPSLPEALEDLSRGVLNGDISYRYDSPSDATLEFAKLALLYCGCRGVDRTSGVPPPVTCVNATCGENQTAEAQLRSWKFSPYNAPAKVLKSLRLPPMLFVASGTELLAGDSQGFAQRAQHLGVHVRVELFDGMWHTFPQWSEGCWGEGETGPALWQGETALQHYGDFATAVRRGVRACPDQLRPKTAADGVLAAPVLTAHQVGEASPAQIAPLQMDVCEVASAARPSLRGRPSGP